MLTLEQHKNLQTKLPDWAIKSHPTKSNMTVIHPMAVIDRLNEVFGLGAWHTEVEKLSAYEWMQKTQKGERKVYTATAKVTFTVPQHDIHLEQFGGSTNDDEGDALKGSATDGLTKIASYLGIGASIYKNMGNTEPPKEVTLDDAFKIVMKASTPEELTKLYKSLPAHLQKDPEVIEKCAEIKESLN